MSAPERLVLDRPRDLGGLLTETLALYRRQFWKFLAMALVVVVPVYAGVLGLGLEQFKGGYDTTPRLGEAVITTVVQVLVIGPLLAVMALHALRELADERAPRAGASIQAGLDAFSIVFPPVLIAVALQILTFPTLVIPVVLGIRLYFVPQLVVVEGKRGADALRASWELTRGLALRTAGLLIVGYLVFWLAGGLLATPLVALAQGLDSGAAGLGASTLAELLVAAPIAIFATLLYFDLVSRQAALRR